MPAELPPWQPKKPRGFTRPPAHYQLKAIDWLAGQVARLPQPLAVGNCAVIVAGTLVGYAGEIVAVMDGAVRLKLFRGGQVTVGGDEVAVISVDKGPG